jgi:oligopeptide transport system ATP-binding protein
VSALDVSIQAQVLNLLISLRRELGLTVLMITHDLRIANFFCDRIAVLYRGQLVELGPRSAVMDAPRHPYTRMLLSAAPTGDPDANPQRPWLRAERGANIGDASAAGCAFSARCALREMLGNPSRCVSQRPGLAAVGPDHQAACHYQDQLPDALTNGDVAAAEATA